jgi:glycine oxidase
LSPTKTESSAGPPDPRSDRVARHPAGLKVDAVLIGGGIVGLAVAWRARARGLSVCVLDRGELGGATSHVAAGMLAPVAEADAGERALLALNLESARLWPAFAAELEDVTGVDVGYRTTGSLLVARDRDEAEALERELGLRTRLGLRAERLLPSAARRTEPALAPGLRAALEMPDDHSVDPRATCAALAAAAERGGALLRPGTEVVRVLVESGRAAGVVLAGGERIAAEAVVVAAGPWSASLDGIPDDARAPVRPVKGQIVRLRDPAGPGLLERVVRWGPPTPGYLVPRADGRIVLGATTEERGFDTSVTALAAYELLRDAGEIVPGVLELAVEELSAALRPGTPDNAPVLGQTGALPGLHYATGHYRGGVLLAPVTADLAAAELAGERPQHAFSPDRFASARAVIA